FKKIIMYEEQEQIEQEELIEQEEQIEQIEQNEQTEQNEQREIIQINKRGRSKSIVWGTYIKQGKQISKSHYNATLKDNLKKSNKKRKLNKKQSQTKVSDFIESTKLTDERIKDINHALVKAFVVSQEIAIINQKVITEINNQDNLTL
ncbi:5872_t:CDS:2, partial [Diversispora eburnea]